MTSWRRTPTRQVGTCDGVLVHQCRRPPSATTCMIGIQAETAPGANGVETAAAGSFTGGRPHLHDRHAATCRRRSQGNCRGRRPNPALTVRSLGENPEFLKPQDSTPKKHVRGQNRGTSLSVAQPNGFSSYVAPLPPSRTLVSPDLSQSHDLPPNSHIPRSSPPLPSPPSVLIPRSLLPSYDLVEENTDAPGRDVRWCSHPPAPPSSLGHDLHDRDTGRNGARSERRGNSGGRVIHRRPSSPPRSVCSNLRRRSQGNCRGRRPNSALTVRSLYMIWGDQGQDALENASIRLLNCGPTGTEALGAIGSVTVVDGSKVEASDLRRTGYWMLGATKG
nr:unnamed protein product [Digitaria exilis]